MGGGKDRKQAVIQGEREREPFSENAGLKIQFEEVSSIKVPAKERSLIRQITYTRGTRGQEGAKDRVERKETQ